MREKRSPGSKHKLTPETHRTLVKALETGLSLKDSAVYSGISYSTLWRWLDMAKEPRARQEYKALARDIESANSRAKAVLLQRIADAGKGPTGDWRASAFLVERRWPEEYGKRTIVQHANADGTGDMKVDVNMSQTFRGVKLDADSLGKLSDEQIESLDKTLSILADADDA